MAASKKKIKASLDPMYSWVPPAGLVVTDPRDQARIRKRFMDRGQTLHYFRQCDLATGKDGAFMPHGEHTWPVPFKRPDDFTHSFCNGRLWSDTIECSDDTTSAFVIAGRDRCVADAARTDRAAGEPFYAQFSINCNEFEKRGEHAPHVHTRPLIEQCMAYCSGWAKE